MVRLVASRIRPSSGWRVRSVKPNDEKIRRMMVANLDGGSVIPAFEGCNRLVSRSNLSIREWIQCICRTDRRNEPREAMPRTPN